MKKPYIKKYGKVSNFIVWIVDGKYIRRDMDEEFTNFGQHYQFNFIPKNEFWIDKEHAEGEERYYIDEMLLMERFLSAGTSRKKAVEATDKKIKSERAKSELMMAELEKMKHHENVLEDVHKKLLKEYCRGDVKVWIVNGEIVRDLFFLDFTEGGHDKVYHFIPEGEVWLDDDVIPEERKFVLLHEMHERNLMARGMNYNSAHESASKIEYYCRLHPEKVDGKLKEEMKKTN